MRRTQTPNIALRPGTAWWCRGTYLSAFTVKVRPRDPRTKRSNDTGVADGAHAVHLRLCRGLSSTMSESQLPGSVCSVCWCDRPNRNVPHPWTRHSAKMSLMPHAAAKTTCRSHGPLYSWESAYLGRLTFTLLVQPQKLGTSELLKDVLQTRVTWCIVAHNQIVPVRFLCGSQHAPGPLAALFFRVTASPSLQINKTTSDWLHRSRARLFPLDAGRLVRSSERRAPFAHPAERLRNRFTLL